ncbi:MAG: PAS domain S-box protein [Elusimicrobiales bacterium]|nr:PAS domain S-box protein [Elusimicrobiales bacterium]
MKESSKIFKQYLLSKNPDFNQISKEILDIIKKKTSSEAGFVGYIDEKTNKLIVPTLTDEVWEICKIKEKKLCFDIKDNLFGIAIKTGKPVVSNDLSIDNRAKGTPRGHIKIKRFLGIPSVIKGKVNGILAVANKKTDYTQKEIEIISEFADVYAAIIYHLIKVKETEEYNKMINTLIENARDIIYVIKKDGTIEYINSRVKDYGYKKEDLIGHNAFDFVAIEYAEYVLSAFNKAFKTGKTLDVLKYKLKRKDGTVFDVDQKSEVILSDSEPKIVGTIRDVTKERAMEKELKESNELFEKIFNSAKDAIYIKDLSGNYVKVNKACAKIFDLTPEEMLKRNDKELFGLKPAEEIHEQDAKVFGGKTLTTTTERIINGKKFILNSIKIPLKDHEGNIKYILGISRDITKIRKLERELTLIKAKENIEKASSQFSHDLNNILSIITGYTSLIEEEILKSKGMLKEIKEIKKSVKKIISVTKQFRKKAPSVIKK